MSRVLIEFAISFDSVIAARQAALTGRDSGFVAELQPQIDSGCVLSLVQETSANELPVSIELVESLAASHGGAFLGYGGHVPLPAAGDDGQSGVREPRQPRPPAPGDVTATTPSL